MYGLDRCSIFKVFMTRTFERNKTVNKTIIINKQLLLHYNNIITSILMI